MATNSKKWNPKKKNWKYWLVIVLIVIGCIYEFYGQLDEFLKEVEEPTIVATSQPWEEEPIAIVTPQKTEKPIATVTQQKTEKPVATATPQKTEKPIATATPLKDNSEYSEEKLEVYFFDVGQADSILLLTGDEAMLVDTGNAGDAALDDKVKNKINLTHELKRLGVEKIDILVATHAHEDHMGSMYKIVRMFDVEDIYANSFSTDEVKKDYFQRFVDALDDSDAHLISPTDLTPQEIKIKIQEYNTQTEEEILALEKVIAEKTAKKEDASEEQALLEELKQEEKLVYHKEDYIWVGDTIPFGNAKVTMLAPKAISYSDLNDSSIVLMVEFEDVRLLLTGDAGALSEREMLEFAEKNQFDLDCDILKVSHHGSRTANTEEFISAVSPEYAVVMVEEGNSYGLPDEDVIERLESHGAIVYQTMEVGDIKLVIDDGSYAFDLSYSHEEKGK